MDKNIPAIIRIEDEIRTEFKRAIFGEPKPQRRRPPRRTLAERAAPWIDYAVKTVPEPPPNDIWYRAEEIEPIPGPFPKVAEVLLDAAEKQTPDVYTIGEPEPAYGAYVMYAKEEQPHVVPISRYSPYVPKLSMPIAPTFDGALFIAAGMIGVLISVAYAFAH